MSLGRGHQEVWGLGQAEPPRRRPMEPLLGSSHSWEVGVAGGGRGDAREELGAQRGGHCAVGMQEPWRS